MLKQKLEKLVQSEKESSGNLVLYKTELEYLEKQHMLAEVVVEEKNPETRFEDAYIERCDKESENLIANETNAFLHQKIDHFKKFKNEFVYLDSKWLEVVGADGVCLELDDVFGTYDVMLGLRLQKKYQASIKTFLESELQGDDTKFDLMFSNEDGLWNLNFALNSVDGFREDLTVGEAYDLIYQFLFKLMEAVEENK